MRIHLRPVHALEIDRLSIHQELVADNLHPFEAHVNTRRLHERVAEFERNRELVQVWCLCAPFQGIVHGQLKADTGFILRGNLT